MENREEIREKRRIETDKAYQWSSIQSVKRLKQSARVHIRLHCTHVRLTRHIEEGDKGIGATMSALTVSFFPQGRE